jgi:hypothetical protein
LDKVWALLQECANESNQPAQQSIADSAATLAGNTMIGYDEFRGLASKLPHKFQPFFKPSVFLRLQHNDEGKIDINQLFSYVLRRGTYQYSWLNMQTAIIK